MFTKDKLRNLIRNYYCLECDAGPFNQSDIINNVLIEKGYGKQTMHYCRKCCKIKFVDRELPLMKDDFLEREAYVKSGKALEDMLLNNKFIHHDQHEEISDIELHKHVIYEKPEIKEVVVAQDSFIEIQEETPHVAKIVEHEKHEISLKNLSAMAVINLVENETGYRITSSPKNKKSILKQAKRILEEKGFKVIQDL